MDGQNTVAAYGNLIDRLRAIRRQWRWLTFSEGLLKCIGILALVMTGTVIVLAMSFQLWQFAFSRWIRIAIVLLSIGGAVYAVIRSFVLPLCNRLTDAAVASRLESTQTGEVFATENRVLSAVQLWPILEDNRLGYAPEFVEHVIVQASRDVEQTQHKRVFQAEFRKIRRSAGIAIGGVILLLVTYFLLPTGFTGFAQAFQTLPKTLQDDQEYLKQSIQITEIQPGTIQIERGTDVNVTAEVGGHLGAPVALYYRVGDMGIQDSKSLPQAEWQSVPMRHTPANTGRSLQVSEISRLPYSATLENVTRPLQYYISVKEVPSEQYQITISNEPIVTQFQYRLNYPAYTQLQPQALPVNVGNIQVLFGTEVVFTGESNKPLQKARIAFDASGDIPLEIREGQLQGAITQLPVGGEEISNQKHSDSRQETPSTPEIIQGSFVARQSENYRIYITDVDGFTNRDPVNRTITVLEDAVPEVTIVAPARDTVLDDAMLVELKVEAMDDYGIQELQLVYRVESEGTEAVNVPLKRWGDEDVRSPRSVFVAYTWDVDRIGMFPGETLAYYVQALDIDDVSGPNIGKSHTYTLRFPSLSELYDAVATEQKTEQRGLEELVDEQADATGLVDTLLDKIRKSQELTLNDENLMQQVLENQKQIEETAKQLIENMQETAEEMEENQLFDAETIEKYQELQDLMEKALSEEHKELLQKLSEALAKQQMDEQERSMAEANLSQEQFLQQLERAKSLYEQILLEQELEAAAKQAKALAEQQKQLMDTLESSVGARSPRPDTNDLAQKEDRVADEFNQLSEKLEELGTKMGELAQNQENAPPQIERLADEIIRLNAFAHEYKLPEMLAATSENLRSGQKSEALESGRGAEQTLTELAQGLDNALAFMEGANANETLTALQEAVGSGLHLSHLHEKVLTQTNDILTTGQSNAYISSEIVRLQQLAADELSASESITQLSSKLWELGNRQIQVPPEAIFHLNASNDALSRAARALEDRQPSLAVPIQRAALADLNQAIFELLEAMGQMNQQMGASGLENMMEQLQQLAESQEQLNEMAQNLNQQMREQGRTPGLEQMMRQLAAQQQLIREATERIAERAEQMAQMLGSLEDVAEEMTEVEKSLRQGELDEDVLDRQAQILTRMLDSLKSLQKRDVGKQRKAEVAARPETPTQEVPPLHPELLEIVRKLETTPYAKEFEDIPFQYREQLRQYFKALSQKRRKK